MVRNDRLRVGDKDWNCTDLNEKLLKQIIKENVALWKLKINFKLHSLFQPSPWGRGWDSLAFECQLCFILICLLKRQCSRVGIPVEQKPVKLYIYDSRFSTSTKDFKTLPWTKPRSPWNIMFIFLRTKTIYWFLPIADRCWWEFRTAITRLDFSYLNEILLEKQSK